MHPRLGNRACFIHTKNIDSRQRLNTFHIVDQYLLLCQPHGTNRKCHTCQQIQSLRNHSDDSRHHTGDTVMKRSLIVNNDCTNRAIPIGMIIIPITMIR